jgi:hypothetical protein
MTNDLTQLRNWLPNQNPNQNLLLKPPLDDDLAFCEKTNRLLALGMQDSKEGIFHPAEWE